MRKISSSVLCSEFRKRQRFCHVTNQSLKRSSVSARRRLGSTRGQTEESPTAKPKLLDSNGNGVKPNKRFFLRTPRNGSNLDFAVLESMEFGRFRFRDHLENGDEFESETSSELLSDGGANSSEPESMTGKGIKRLCSELVELKSSSDQEFYQNVVADYSAFLRIFEEAKVMESEVNQLRDKIVLEKQLVKSLADVVSLKVLSDEMIEGVIDDECEERCVISKLEDHTDSVLEILDTLLCEQRLDEALCVLEMEEVVLQRILIEDEHDMDVLAFYKSSVLSRKAMLVKRFVTLADDLRVNESELRMALMGLCRLQENQLATQLLLRHYRSRMKKGKQSLHSSKSLLNDLYVKELSKFVFSTISQSAKCFKAVHGEISYASQLIEWAHEETAAFAACFSEYVESVSKTESGLSIVTESVHIAMTFCLMLESQNIVLQPCLAKHIRPSLENVVETQMRHYNKVVRIFTSCDTWDLSRYLVSKIISEGIPLVNKGEELEYCLLTSSGRKFITLLQAIIKDVCLLFTAQMGSAIIKVLMDLFTEYISIVQGALIMIDKTDVSDGDDGPSINMTAVSFLQQVSVLLNVSTVYYFYSNLVTGAIHNTLPSNLEKFTVEQQLTESLLRLNETYGLLKCHFYQRFINQQPSVENNLLCLSGNCLHEAHKSTVDHGLPSLKFQVLFLELRKLEDFSEENEIEDDWLMDLLKDFIEAVFVSMSKDTWIHIRGDAEFQDVDSYKQLVLDIQFMVEIARYEGCLTDHLLVSSTTLISQLESASTKLTANREISYSSWSAWSRNSATKSIEMLLEFHLAKPASNDHGMSSSSNESHFGSNCLEDDMSSLSENSDELKDRLQMEVEQVFINTQELSLTRLNINDDENLLAH